MKMKRKTMYCMLSLCLLSAASVKAQVRIGGLSNPNPSAVLDLNATDATNNGALGLALPRVELTSTTSYAPLKAHVAGMTVYNTKLTGDVTPGTYYNDGSKWVRIGSVSSVEPLISEEDGIVGNEVLNATTNGGLIRAGSGTATSPFTLGIADNGVTSARIENGAVTADDLATGAVTLDKMATGSVNSTKIVDGTVAAVDLASNAVITAKILNANVTLDKLASNSVNSDKIVDASIATADLADGAVTAAKLNAMDATANQALVYDGSAWVPTTLSASAYSSGGNIRPTRTSTGCDGSILYFGAFDYSNGGTSGDVAKGVTNASNDANNGTLPNLSSTPAESDFRRNSNYYLCVYKTNGSSNWANAVNNCATGTYADGDASAGWYLPNARELRYIYELLGVNGGNNLSFHDNLASERGIMVTYSSDMVSTGYWSSTEASAAFAWNFDFSNGTCNTNYSKTTTNLYVRCVKRLSAI
jgi:hypothetical protein